MKAHVAVLYTPGTNCHEETRDAIARIPGVKSTLVILSDKGKLSHGLKNFSHLIIPGGFSFGDHFGAGRVLSILIKRHLADELKEFTAKKNRILGICNGFQVLVELGLLPGALIQNASKKFESRWIKIVSAYRGLGGYMDFGNNALSLPVAHAEGRIILPQSATVCPAFYYADAKGIPTMSYPENPAESTLAIAGLFGQSGRILAMMPHPERAALPHHKSQDGLLILRNFFIEK